jgi:chromosome segregation ATPase
VGAVNAEQRRLSEAGAERLHEAEQTIAAAMAAAVAGAAGDDDAIAELRRSLAEQSRELLDALSAASHELHASLAKRFDARTKAIADNLDGLAASLDAARKLGPSLDKVGSRLEAQQPYLDQIRHQLVQLAAAMAAVPADVERRHAETTASMEKVADGLAGLRRHAAALDRAVQGMRESHEILTTSVVDLRDGAGAMPAKLDHLSTAAEQQQAMANRLTELVTQVRSATRSDIERVESSIHLEVLKQHQVDQARLAQAVAGVSEVVEREAAVLHQRLSALAAEVDAVRLELAVPAGSGESSE